MPTRTAHNTRAHTLDPVLPLESAGVANDGAVGACPPLRGPVGATGRAFPSRREYPRHNLRICFQVHHARNGLESVPARA